MPTSKEINIIKEEIADMYIRFFLQSINIRLHNRIYGHYKEQFCMLLGI